MTTTGSPQRGSERDERKREMVAVHRVARLELKVEFAAVAQPGAGLLLQRRAPDQVREPVRKHAALDGRGAPEKAQRLARREAVLVVAELGEISRYQGQECLRRPARHAARCLFSMAQTFKTRRGAKAKLAELNSAIT